MEKLAVRFFVVIATVVLFSCAGTGQKRVEQEQPREKPAAEASAVSKEKTQEKNLALFDVVPSKDRKPHPHKIVPHIPAEYDGLVKIFDTYWDALKKRDYKTAYDLESAELRKTTSFDAYKGKFKQEVMVINVTALGVKKISEKEVIVRGTMILKANMEGPKDVLQEFYERWTDEGGEWRHVPQTKKNG